MLLLLLLSVLTSGLVSVLTLDSVSVLVSVRETLALGGFGQVLGMSLQLVVVSFVAIVVPAVVDALVLYQTRAVFAVLVPVSTFGECGADVDVEVGVVAGVFLSCFFRAFVCYLLLSYLLVAYLLDCPCFFVWPLVSLPICVIVLSKFPGGCFF